MEIGGDARSILELCRSVWLGVIRLRKSECTRVWRVAVAMTFLLAVPVFGQDVLSRVPGTYSLSICREECAARDSTDIVVSGILVLADSSSLADGIAAAAWESLRNDSHFLIARRAGPVNGCFVLERHGHTRGFFAGIIRAGLTVWTGTPSDSVVVPLYRSPDGGFNIIVEVSAIGFRSHGIQWHAPNEPLHDLGHVFGLRLGPPDPGRCSSANGGY